jgi:UDP-glucose 4-epimerase
MKKILVTGGCGFVGSNLVDILIEQGNDVFVIDDLSFGKKEYCNSKARYVFDDFKKVLKNYDEKMDVIFHLAAEARIQPSFENPLYTCENNSYGTAIVCEYARKNNSMVVYAGSSSFYGGVYLNPYAFAKWQGEETIKMYTQIYNIRSGIARFFNVYGPRNPLIGQYTPVVAIFEQQMLNNQPLTIVGDGEQRRDFTHVFDICQGLIDISLKDRKAEVYNLGAGKNYSINELADLFGGERRYLPARPGEARETLADTTKINKITGWEANHDLTKYIKEFKNEII